MQSKLPEKCWKSSRHEKVPGKAVNLCFSCLLLILKAVQN